MRSLVVLVLLASCVAAAKPKKPVKPPPAPAETKPAEAKPEVKARVDASGPADAVLASLRELYASLEYDQVIPLATALLAREDLSLEQRLEAYRLQGSARAIVEDPVDAEKPFRLLLRARPEYDLPQDTPPKILAVFRKVQSEEKALASQLQEVERARTIANLKLLGEPPSEAKGGLPVKFNFRLRDPSGAVETIRVPYRRGGQKTFSSLALERNEDGDWKGQIPGEFTADEKGFSLEYYVETADAKGPLLSVGNGSAPRAINVLPGQVPSGRVKPVPAWAFWTGVGVTGALGASAGGLGVAFNSSQAEYKRLAASGEVDGALLAQKARTGDALATATNAAMISAGVALVGTLIMWPLTRFGE